MKKVLFILGMAGVMLFAACGKDDDGNNNGNGNGNDVKEAVDLGLPSGTKWATCNVGADSPEQYGNYYAWGEIQSKTVYDWSTYQYGSDYGNTQNLGADIAGTQYDAARANWGENWRMPSKEQCEELANSCSWSEEAENGVQGIRVTGPNGNSIFLPYAGCRNGESGVDVVSGCYYWASTSDNDAAYALCPYSEGVDVTTIYRFQGQTIRPVHN